MPAKTSVVDEGDVIRFMVGNISLLDARANDLKCIYHVRSGSDVWANDEAFWTLVFGKMMAVVPEETQGLYAFLARCKTRLTSEDIGFEAVCAMAPKHWRQRFLGFIPVPSIQFAAYPSSQLSELDEWQIVKPLSLDMYLG